MLIEVKIKLIYCILILFVFSAFFRDSISGTIIKLISLIIIVKSLIFDVNLEKAITLITISSTEIKNVKRI